MGFNKVFVDKEILVKYLEKNKPLKMLFKADAFIFLDSISSEAYELYTRGATDEEIKKKIYNENNSSN